LAKIGVFNWSDRQKIGVLNMANPLYEHSLLKRADEKGVPFLLKKGHTSIINLYWHLSIKLGKNTIKI